MEQEKVRELKTYGQQLAIEADEAGVLYSKCHTLEFVHLLQTSSENVHRKVRGTQYSSRTQRDFGVVGIRVRTTEPLTVPVIDAQYNSKNFVPEGTKIETKDYPAGSVIQMTLYELAMVLARPEFGGFFARTEEKDPKGMQLVLKLSYYYEKSAVKVPTPTVTFSRPHSGSPKETAVLIDEKDAESGCYRVYPEFAEKFAVYGTKKLHVPAVDTGAVSEVTKSIAIFGLLAGKYGVPGFPDTKEDLAKLKEG